MSDNGHNGRSTQIAREYFDSLFVEMRTIDAVKASTNMTLFGESFATPVMLAALSALEGTYAKGMVEAAKGAKASDTVMWAGIGSEKELEAVLATGAKTIKIVKPYADEDIIFKKIEHAEKAGVLAVGMDVSFGFGHMRAKGFAMGNAMAPKTVSQLKQYIKATKLPFVLKGVMSVQDAEKALEAGAGGMVLSHHGGNMHYAVPPLMILPNIAEKVNKQMPIFMVIVVTSIDINICIQNNVVQ